MHNQPNSRRRSLLTRGVLAALALAAIIAGAGLSAHQGVRHHDANRIWKSSIASEAAPTVAGPMNRIW